MKKLLKFVLVSGMGFIIDFIIYNILALILNINVDVSNVISSFIGVSFVFFTSTKKIFANNVNGISLKYKYFIYVIYQVILIILVSKIILFFSNSLIKSDIKFISQYAKIIAKICITPITLLINYLVMKKLTKL